MNNEELQSLKITLVEINNEIKNMLAKQEDLHSDIRDVKSAIYNPDSGLYARIKNLDERIKDLESWQGNITKIIWTIITTVTGLVVATIYKLII